MREQALNDARTLVFKTHAGVMSTISNNLRGYPFGSVTPYMGCLLYTSDAADE